MSRVFSHTSCAMDGSKCRLVTRLTTRVNAPPVKMAATLPANMLISAPDDIICLFIKLENPYVILQFFYLIMLVLWI